MSHYVLVLLPNDCFAARSGGHVMERGNIRSIESEVSSDRFEKLSRK